MTSPPLPNPAVVVLVGAAGSGKSHWAAAHHPGRETVSSDALRAVVGTGEHDLDASVEAFRLLDQIVAARSKRGLTTVIDTLGLDTGRRRGYLAAAHAAGLPAVAVVLDTDPALCRQRNATRDRPVPSAALRAQLARMQVVRSEIDDEGWDLVRRERAVAPAPVVGPSTPAIDPPRLEFVLQLSRFPWGTEPAAWLTGMARAAEDAGFAGLALMDHLIQIPHVDRAWEPIPEPYVTLGLLAGATTTLRLGTLVSPVTFRPAGVLAKAVATLDVLSAGRAFLGLGAGWWGREHAAFGVPFPSTADRLDLLETAVETVRGLWAPGTRALTGRRAALPETTCYPRPLGTVPIIIGGSGERRTLRIAARYADACNLPSDPVVLDHKTAVLRQHCVDVGRDPDDVRITVLDTPVIGADRDEVDRLVDRFRGRSTPAGYAARHPAGTVDDHLGRYRALADRGVRTVFVAPQGIAGPDDLHRLAAIPAAFDH